LNHLKRNLPTALACGLLILGLVVSVPTVMAQSTNISNLVFPSTVTYNSDTGASNPPLLVKATVNYEGAEPGFYLAAGVFDLDIGAIVSGVSSSTPSSCLTTTQLAECDIPLAAALGSENFEFLLDSPSSIWNLAFVAALRNSTGSTISSSVSNYTFTITVHTGITLGIDAPPPVPITVDGINGTGTVLLNLAKGPHLVSVPQVVLLNNGTRLRFTRWSDGAAAISRTIVLTRDVTIRAIYETQYLLSVISPEVAVTGAAWYDNGTNATISIPSTTVPMAGALGTFGAKWTFTGWSENGQVASKSTTWSMYITSPRVITADWQADYSAPATIIALVLISIALCVILLKTGSGKRRRKSRIYKD